MKADKFEFLSLGHARARREVLAAWAADDADPELVDSWCRAEEGYSEQIDRLRDRLVSQFTGGLPNWTYLDEFKAAIHYIAKAEREAIHRKTT
jgi:hypothetical protein